METLYWISLSYATFGIVVASGSRKITEAAPIANWTIGKNTDYVLTYYQNKGAEIRKANNGHT